jgi:hypothetical protein
MADIVHAGIALSIAALTYLAATRVLGLVWALFD